MKIGHLGLFVALVIPAVVHGNPTGGTVASGSASVSSSGKVLTVNQNSATTIINWDTFSIGAGETTKFVQPSALSAALNRVTGGQTSVINGTLSANGQVYLINGNGIFVGKSGKVNTNGFTASTLDISDSDFLAGNQHFTGNSSATVQNLGTISAPTGNIYLIGQQVSNGGVISAPNGTAGLAAGLDILLAQQNADGSTVKVSPTAGATAVNGNGVTNTGKISAAMAELRAANGNIYALAINNSGSIRANGVKKAGGKVWLVADKGNVVTSGSVTTNAGGKIETSAEHVGISGVVSAGKGGQWTIDPTDSTITTAPDNGNFNINSKTLTTALNAGTTTLLNITADSTFSGNLDINTALTWNSTAFFEITAAHDVNINAPITAGKGALRLMVGNLVNAQAAVQVANFEMAAGSWIQIAGTPGMAKLPVFSATQDFEIFSGATFARFGGGNGGGSPYQITDIYGLQGIGSNSVTEGENYVITAPINGAVTKNWDLGSGFNPIANFTGTLDGGNKAISGLNINLSSNAGLFAATQGTLTDVTLTGATVNGNNFIGILAAENNGLINGCSISGTINALGAVAKTQIGGVAGSNEGEINNTTTNITINVAVDSNNYDTNKIGGLTGYNYAFVGSTLEGYISNCTTSGTINITGNGSVEPFPDHNTNVVGGMVGDNQTSVVSSTNKMVIKVTAPDCNVVGGIVGDDFGPVTNCTNSGSVTTAGGFEVGGLVGSVEDTTSITSSHNTGAITVTAVADSFFDNAESVSGLIGAGVPLKVDSCTNTGSITILSRALEQDIGGLLGDGQGSSTEFVNCSNSGAIKLSVHATDVGGLGGDLQSFGEISGCTNSGSITVLAATGASSANIGGLFGEMGHNPLIFQCSSTGAISLPTGGSNIGGLVGDYSGAEISQSSSNCVITLGTTASFVGGMAGVIDNGGFIDYSTSAGSLVIKGNSDLLPIQSVGGMVGATTGSFLDVSSSEKLTFTDAGKLQSSSFSNIGGIVGAMQGLSVEDATFTGSLNVAAAAAGDIGGIAGSSSTGSILDSLNSGTITVSGHTAQSVGGIIGNYNSPSSTFTITSDSNTGAITVTSGVSDDVGGIVGLLLHGKVKDSFNSAAVKATAQSVAVGGITGENVLGGFLQDDGNTGSVAGSITGGSTGDFGGVAGANTGAIQNCFNTGAVSGSGANIGGVAGYDAGGIALAYNTGSVTALGTGSSGVGGLIGRASGLLSEQVTVTYSTGKVSGKGTGFGGLVGLDSSGAGDVSLSYWNQQSSGQTTSVDGIAVATTALMNTQSTYANFDFTTEWGMPAGGTPYLLVFQQPLH